tara:strand:- start:202 stop:567 length:366 start_codon:yes stop_codon:yes gene_type:complete
MKIIKIIFLIISLNFIALISNAANVSCNFDTGESYNITDGSWEGSLGWESLYDLFGDGLTLPLENSLLSELDKGYIFKAGTTPKGDVYLAGSDMGIAGRMSNIKDGSIIIYSGYCDVGFGD